MNEKAELKETRYTHISGTDGLPLSVLRVEPVCPDKIKGIIQIVHGKNDGFFAVLPGELQSGGGSIAVA